MADEPISPQKLIDDAAKELDKLPVPEVPEEPKKELSSTPLPQMTELPIMEDVKTPPVMTVIAEQPSEIKPSPIPPMPVVETPPAPPIPEQMIVVEKTEEKKEEILPPPVPESMIIPAKEAEEKKGDQPLNPPKPEKKKTGKGILIATLLFFIFTLPIALYYVTQSPQFAEIRSRATGCPKSTDPSTYTDTCADSHCCNCSNASGWSDCSAGSAYECRTCTGGFQRRIKPTGAVQPTTANPTHTIDQACTPFGRVTYTTGPCAGRATSATDCALDCGNKCCNRLNEVCCCMGCFPKGTDCSKAPQNCQNPPTVGCPQTACYNNYPATAVPHENCLICSPDRSKLKTVTFSSDGTVRIHMDNVAAGTTVSLTKGGSTATTTKISEGNFNADITAGTYTINVKLGNETTNSVGFIRPDSSNKCGRYDPNNKRDISSAISALSSYNITTTSGVDNPYQCWADAIQGEDNDQRGQLDANYDFNDFDVIIGYTTGVTPTNEPTNAPGKCDASCDSDSNCESGLSCVTATGVKRCRKAACPDKTDCSCPAATATPTTPVVYNTPTPIVYRTPTPTTARLIAAATPTPTPTNQPTPKIPVAGVGPGVFGAISVAGSILLVLAGLVL